MEKEKQKTSRQKLVICLICAAATLILLIFSFVSFGWFTNNRSVDGNMNTLATTNGKFDLAAVGTAGKYDSYIAAPNGDNASVENITENLIATSDGKPEIKWVMSDQSNVGNDSTNEGIQPGSHGKLTFYVISRQNTDLNLIFSLDTVLYSSKARPISDTNDNTSYIIPDTETEAKLVKGHIMFFEKYDETSGTYSDRITDTFTFTQNGAEADKAYQVDIYYIWPEVIDQLILPPDDNLLTHNNTKLNRIIAPGDSIIDVDSQAYWFAENIENLQEKIENVSKGSDNANFSRDYYDLLNAKWNDADQKIGTKVGYVELKLTADDNPTGA